MTDNDPWREGGVPMHPCVATYEARLILLERELPPFERELRRVEARGARRGLAYRDLS